MQEVGFEPTMFTPMGQESHSCAFDQTQPFLRIHPLGIEPRR